MRWSGTADLVAMACMLAGAGLCLLAGIGLVRLPDVLTRMHAATKPQVLGLLLVLLGAALRLRSAVDVGTLVLVGRAAYRTGRNGSAHLVVDELATAPGELTGRPQEERDG